MTTAYFFDHLATDADIAVTVTEGDFEAARRELVGSVSAKELEHYARVRAAFEGPETLMQKAGKPPNLPAPEMRRGPLPTRPKNHMNTTLNGKARAVKGPNVAPNGKGKTAGWDSSEEEDDDDEAYITSNDFQATPERGSKSSGVAGFRGGNLEDEEEMYE